VTIPAKVCTEREDISKILPLIVIIADVADKVPVIVELALKVILVEVVVKEEDIVDGILTVIAPVPTVPCK
jgi:hypothetical protein